MRQVASGTRNGTWEHGSCMLLAAAVEVQTCAAIYCHHSILTSVHCWQSLAFPTWECTWNQLICAYSLSAHCHTLIILIRSNMSKLIYRISMVSSKHPEGLWLLRKLPDESCDFWSSSLSRSHTTATFLCTSCFTCRLTQSADFLSSQWSLGIRGWTGQTLAAKDKLCYKGKLKKSWPAFVLNF